MTVHPIPPVFDKNSKILILGSFPSVKSREDKFFYAHPQNRFWKVLAAVFDDNIPVSVEEKKTFLYSNGIALWDVIASCDIEGSSDVSIKNAKANDISVILENCRIEKIFVNGRTAQRLYEKHIEPVTGRKASYLPSTSPANASASLEELKRIWKDSIITQ